MAVLADRPLTVDVSVAIYKIFHKAFITLFANYNITLIKFFCISKQRIKFLLDILFCNDVMRMIPSKKREVNYSICSYKFRLLFRVIALKSLKT